MSNLKIREEAKMAGVRHWQVAEALHISEATFCRWMRKELPQEKIQEILGIIRRIKEANKNDD